MENQIFHTDKNKLKCGPITQTATDGSTVTTGYTSLSASVTDALERVTTTTFDARGRTSEVSPQSGPGVQYSYDEMDRLIQTDTGRAVTSITYDAAGRTTERQLNIYRQAQRG